MALAAAVQNGLRPIQSITWTRESDGTPENLDGATLTGRIIDLTTMVVRDIVGDLDVIDGAGGVFTWTYDADDVVDEGDYEVQFTAAFGTPPTPAKSFRSQWKIMGSLDA